MNTVLGVNHKTTRRDEMRATLLRGIAVLDGIGDQPLVGQTILIERERISQIGPATDFTAEWGSDVEILDLDGMTALPGLINCHEHLDTKHAFGSFQARVSQPAQLLTLRAFRNALIDLASGVTTVRDMASKEANSLAVRRAIDEGMVIGPRIITCGQALCITGGHGHQRAWQVDGVDEARRAARTLLRAGADLIKVMASGGMTQVTGDLATSAQLTVQEMRAAFDEAHRAGKPTAAHAHPPAAIRAAIEAGVDCIEHGIFLDKATAELMASKGIAYVPTMSEGPAMVKRGSSLGRPAALVARAADSIEPHERALRNALDAGVTVGVGTDVLGDMVEELELLIAAGMSPVAAIKAATSVAARIVNVTDVGIIRPGKLADIIVVRSDPLRSLEALRDVHLVIKNGKQYWPSQVAEATGRVPV